MSAPVILVLAVAAYLALVWAAWRFGEWSADRWLRRHCPALVRLARGEPLP
jgi:hypothetical protein